MNKVTRIALTVALLTANGIASTNTAAAHGLAMANFGHGFGRYYPPEPTLRQYYPPAAPHDVRRHARIIPAHPPSDNGYRGPNGPICHTVSLHSAPNCVSAGGTIGGGYEANGWHIAPYCVLCD